MIRNLFRRKKPLVKKKQPTAKPKAKSTSPKEAAKEPLKKILTAEGWKRLMMRPKKAKKS